MNEKKKVIFASTDNGLIYVFSNCSKIQCLDYGLEVLGTIGEEGADCITSLCVDDGSNWFVKTLYAFFSGQAE